MSQRVLLWDKTCADDTVSPQKEEGGDTFGTMEFLLYHVARAVIRLLQWLPLDWVAQMGRVFGALFYWCDARHRRVVIKNLTACFGGEKSPEEIKRLAKENFRRIGENFASAVHTAGLTWEELRGRCEFVGLEKFDRYLNGEKPGNVLVAIGHFGNFELYARAAQAGGWRHAATTYRGLKQESLNRLMQTMRAKSGVIFFERRNDAAALKEAMTASGMVLGLLGDQHAGDKGLRLPFLGRECSTSAAPALFALRYHCPLFSSICYRVALGQWRIEVGDEIPTRENGVARSVEAITCDMNAAFEAGVRRDPANWFWVHNRWKAPPRKR